MSPETKTHLPTESRSLPTLSQWRLWFMSERIKYFTSGKTNSCVYIHRSSPHHVNLSSFTSRCFILQELQQPEPGDSSVQPCLPKNTLVPHLPASPSLPFFSLPLAPSLCFSVALPLKLITWHNAGTKVWVTLQLAGKVFQRVAAIGFSEHFCIILEAVSSQLFTSYCAVTTRRNSKCQGILLLRHLLTSSHHLSPHPLRNRASFSPVPSAHAFLKALSACQSDIH